MKKIITPLVIGLLILAYFTFFRDSVNNEQKVLKPINSIELKVPEPSGLYFDNLNNILYTVSDETSKIYLLNLHGNVLDSISVDGFDLEGISKLNDSTLVTILERDRKVVFISDSGKSIFSFKININGELNKGLEGITVNKQLKRIYILNEKEPGVLFICNYDGTLVNKIKLNFCSDYSGIDYVKNTNELWMVSDESQKVIVCNMNGEVLRMYKTNIEQVEGIAIDYENKLLYLISDPLNKLYIYNLPN